MVLTLTKLMLFCLPLLLGAESSGSISGRVTTDSGDPLRDANVIIPGTDRGGATDERGNYVIDRLPAGEYSLEFSHVGFATVLIGGVEVLPNNTTYVNIALKTAAIEMPPVEVTSQHYLIEPYERFNGWNPADTISGKISDAITSEAMSEAYVLLWNQSRGPTGCATVTDQEGKYYLLQETGDYPYTYCLNISKPGYQTATLCDVRWMPDTTIFYNVSLQPTHHEELYSQVPPESAGTISGIVYNHNRSPFSDVHYILYQDDEEIGVIGKTDDSGNYLIANLPPGRYDIEFRTLRGYFPYLMINIPVRSGQTFNHHVFMNMINPPYRYEPIITTIRSYIIPLNVYDWEVIMPERRE